MSEDLRPPQEEQDGDIITYKSFLEAAYKPDPERPMTRIVVSSDRVVVIGHSVDKAACVAISAAVQTFAAIGKALNVVKRVELDETGQEPVYDVVLEPGVVASLLIRGVMASFYGISKQAPGSMLLNDSRKNRIEGHTNGSQRQGTDDGAGSRP